MRALEDRGDPVLRLGTNMLATAAPHRTWVQRALRAFSQPSATRDILALLLLATALVFAWWDYAVLPFVPAPFTAALLVIVILLLLWQPRVILFGPVSFS